MVGSLRRLVRERRPDVIHAGNVHRGALVAALAGVHPLVTMSWGSDILRDARSGLGRWGAQLVLERSDAFVGDCEAVRKRAIGLGMEPDRVFVFPWGVDLDGSPSSRGPDLRKVLGWEAAFVLIAARSWDRDYGMDIVAEGFSMAAASEPALRLLLVGTGPKRKQILRTLRASSVTNRTHLAGPVAHAEIPRYFHSADLYVTASRSDGTSVTMLEAMASGLPAIASDIASNLEWVVPGSNGWTFRDGDPRSLAETILLAARSRSKLPGMARAARNVVEARADWSKNFPLLEQAYRTAQARAHAEGR
jgi:glycosyltransferase involved in cell wall biosynthesis